MAEWNTRGFQMSVLFERVGSTPTVPTKERTNMSKKKKRKEKRIRRKRDLGQVFSKEFLQREYLGKRKSEAMIAKEANCWPSSVYYWRKKHEVYTHSRLAPNVIDLTGKRFGKWLVLRRADRKNAADVRAYWECQCACGTRRTVVGGSLQVGTSKSCGCIQKYDNLRGYKGLYISYWRRLKKSAVDRGRVFEITMPYAWQVFEAQDKKCALSGIPLFLTAEGAGKGHTASIDRIDPTQDYVVGNIRWIHKVINRMRWTYTDEEFLKYCRLIVRKCGMR